MERVLLLDTDRVRFAEEVDYILPLGLPTAETARPGFRWPGGDGRAAYGSG